MDFAQYAQALTAGDLQLSDEQQQRFAKLAKAITERLKPDTIISRDAMRAIVDEARKSLE